MAISCPEHIEQLTPPVEHVVATAVTGSPRGSSLNLSSKTPAPASHERMAQLDGLRGFVAVGVVIVHYLDAESFKVPAIGTFFRLLEMSPLSLDIFFILSGFLIGGILQRTKNNQDYYKSFYRRRFSRILPVYYAWMALFVVFYAADRGWGMEPPTAYSGTFYLLSFACFFQNFFTSIIESTFMMAPTWTLAVEEHFYLLIPFGVRRLSSRRLVQMLLGVVILAPVFRGVLIKFIGHRSEWADIATRIWTPCRADALAIGVLLALAWQLPEKRAWLQNRVPLFRGGMLAFTGLAFALMWMDNANFAHFHFLNVIFGRSAVELACLSLILFLLCHPQASISRFLSSKTMVKFGQISYCLYVIHWGVYWMIFRFLLHARFGERPWLDWIVAPIALAISCSIASLSWKHFEQPIIDLARRQGEKPLFRGMPKGQTQAV